MRSFLIVCTLAICGLSLFFENADAKTRAYYQYENSHFIVLSNSSEARVRKLLNELEYFRAAAIQATDIATRSDAAKVIVVLTATTKEFKDIRYSKDLAGFAWSFLGSYIMVLPASGDMEDRLIVLRHEFTHTLMRFREHRYPMWYLEGLAEMTTSIEISKDRKFFTYGKPVKRLWNKSAMTVDWNELIQPEFDAHALRSIRLRSSAYSQAWLLTHYLTLGESRGNTEKIDRYFQAVEDGRAATETFIHIFGKSPADLWKETLRPYTKHLLNVRRPLIADNVDLEFSKSDPGSARIEWVFRVLHAIRDTVFFANSANIEIESATGSWGSLDLEGACPATHEFSVDGMNKQFRIADYYVRSDGESMDGHFAYEPNADNSYRLTAIPQEYVVTEDTDLKLSFEDLDTICLSQYGIGDAICSGTFLRCYE